MDIFSFQRACASRSLFRSADAAYRESREGISTMIQLVGHMRTGTWALLLLAASAAAADGDQHFRLVVLHNNDMHARFEQTNAQSGRCAQKHLSTNDCYGGFARVASFVKEVKAKEPNVVFLNAGDTYQGTTWYTVHKWSVVAHFMQMIGLDAMVRFCF
jgi:2',3'-cyclic-nucleotide 2'-phosphodiesterase (5'-nucleotidase family)